MRGIKILLGLFLSMGVLIAMMSFYEISLSGTMDKLGLVGADLTNMVSSENLNELGLSVKSGWECGLVSRAKGSVEFFLSGDSEQGQLSFRLGELRVLCGAGMMKAGEVETGTYEVMKGLGYLLTGYEQAIERGSVDLRACENLPDHALRTTMVGLISSTSGKVYQLLSDEWGKVENLREQVEEMCLDERESRR